MTDGFGRGRVFRSAAIARVVPGQGAFMKVFLMEFNELSPALMEGFILSGALPNFDRLRGQSQVFLTDAREQGPFLQPWIQWVTVHTGLPYSEHRVFHIGHSNECRMPRIADVLAQQGGVSWVCGSMNAYPQEKVRGHYLPDPWAVEMDPQPASLAPFFRFVSGIVQEHERSDSLMSGRAVADFAIFMARHGISPGTVWALVRQLVSERRGMNRWRRAMVLDGLQFDLFRHVFRRLQPEFSTFFSNSTAHIQHHFWSEAEHQVFQGKAIRNVRGIEASPIFQGYRSMDRLLGNLCGLADKDTAVILCTALGQQQCLPGSVEQSQLFRPRDLAGFARFVGIAAACTIEPAMGGEFGYRFESEDAAVSASRHFDGVRIGGQRFGHVGREGKKVLLNYSISSLPTDETRVQNGAGRTASFGELFYSRGYIRGIHHPDGMCWIRIPGKAGAVHPAKVDLTSLAPTILGLLGRKVPPHMRGAPLELGL
jgi:hypothetical protein